MRWAHSPSSWRYSGSTQSTGTWEFSTGGWWRDPQRKWPWTRRGKPTTSAGRCCHRAHLARTGWSRSSWICGWTGPGWIYPGFSTLSLSGHLPSPRPQQSEKKKKKKLDRGGGERFRRFGELQPAPPDAPAAQPCLSQPPPAPLCLLIWLLRAVWKVEWNSETRAQINIYLKKKTYFEIRRSHQSCASRCAFMAGLARHPFWIVRKNHILFFFCPPPKKTSQFPDSPDG